jgi:hypothetical protein
LLTRPAGEVVAEGAVTGYPAGVEQAQRHLEIAVRQRERLANAANAVIEAEAGVPDRVPQRVRHGRHIPDPIVDENDVEIAGRCELTTPISPDRDDGDTLVVSE